MWEFDPEELSRTHECTKAYQFRQLATEAILSRLSGDTTKAQYDLALESLTTLRDDCLNSLDAFHRSLLYGRHRCVDSAFRDIKACLTGASLLAPEPVPETAQPAHPPPRPQPLTDEEQLAAIERLIRENAQQTIFGSRAEGEEQ